MISYTKAPEISDERFNFNQSGVSINPLSLRARKIMYINFAIVGLMLLNATGLRANDTVPKCIEIPVVQSWSELREAPVFAEGDFGIVRLGMEARECPQYSGVLLYALVERGTAPNSLLHYDHPDALGPLVLKYQSERPGSKSPVLQQRQLGLSENKDVISKSNEVLYTRIAMLQSNDCQIKIQSPTGKTVTALIQQTSEVFEPWSSLSLEHSANAGKANGAVCEIRSVAQAMVRAMPVHNGANPQFADMQPDGEESLPKLWPSNPSKTIKLAAKTHGLLLQSDSAIELSSIEENLLARWWVNGEFVAPQALAVHVLRERTGRMIAGNQLEIVLDRDCFQGVAKTGDRIGVQLLHVPQGWTGTGDQHSKIQLISRSNQRPPSLRMTERIDFTLE